MRKLILIASLLLISSSLVFASNDRVSVRVEFKKFVWICPSCAQEDIEDRPVSGGAEYIHTCSNCGEKFNQSGPNMKEYNGTLSYPYDTYAEAKDIDQKKAEACSAWIYEYKHPVPYVEPSVADLTNEKLETQKRVDEVQARIDAKISVKPISDTPISK